MAVINLRRKEVVIVHDKVVLESNGLKSMEKTIQQGLTALNTKNPFANVYRVVVQSTNENKTLIKNIEKIIDSNVGFIVKGYKNNVFVEYVTEQDSEILTEYLENLRTHLAEFQRLSDLEDVRIERLNKLYAENETKELEEIITSTTTQIRDLSYLIKEALSKDNYLTEKAYTEERTNLSLDVDFQRDVVWSLEQKQELIRSLFLDMPIGNFYINLLNFYEEQYESFGTKEELARIDNILYDGKQRLSAIIEFINGEFEVEFNGQTYNVANLSERSLQKILNKTVNVYVTNIADKKELIDFYVLINTSQTKHSSEDIDKALEIRNNL